MFFCEKRKLHKPQNKVLSTYNSDLLSTVNNVNPIVFSCKFVRSYIKLHPNVPVSHIISFQLAIFGKNLSRHPFLPNSPLEKNTMKLLYYIH